MKHSHREKKNQAKDPNSRGASSAAKQTGRHSLNFQQHYINIYRILHLQSVTHFEISNSNSFTYLLELIAYTFVRLHTHISLLFINRFNSMQTIITESKN